MRKLVLLISFGLLSGCGTYSETFDCKPGKGIGCKSLTFVNRMVERGNLPFDEDGLNDVDVIQKKGVEPLLLGFKMWIAGYRDEDGYYHDSSYVHLGGN